MENGDRTVWKQGTFLYIANFPSSILHSQLFPAGKEPPACAGRLRSVGCFVNYALMTLTSRYSELTRVLISVVLLLAVQSSSRSCRKASRFSPAASKAFCVGP